MSAAEHVVRRFLVDELLCARRVASYDLLWRAGSHPVALEEDAMESLARRGLYRSREHRIIAGVCGGLANWLDWNPTVVRVLFVLVSFLSAAFPGILVYLILWAIMPEAPERRASAEPRGEMEESLGSWQPPETTAQHDVTERHP